MATEGLSTAELIKLRRLGITVTGIGADGSTGATGPVGATGPEGDPGGATGATGASGAAAATGATGPTGATGSRGTTGATGTTGIQGATGPAGATGAGTTGATGVAGPTGATGPAGATGAGTTGATGATGTAGTAGATGATGAGATGVAGATGATGVAGATGTAGTPGATGLRGATGADSTVPGATGATGVGISTATISGAGNLLLTLSTSVIVDVGVVKGQTGATGAAGAGGTGNTVGNIFVVSRPAELMVGNVFSGLHLRNDTGYPGVLLSHNIPGQYNEHFSIFSTPTGNKLPININANAMLTLATTNQGEAYLGSFGTHKIITGPKFLSTHQRPVDFSSAGQVGNMQVTPDGNLYVLTDAYTANGLYRWKQIQLSDYGTFNKGSGGGATGATGAAGTNGATGASGPVGATGQQGFQGDVGDTGATGPQGIQGATGPQGATGLSGTNGIDGATGATGLIGATGVAQSQESIIVVAPPGNDFNKTVFLDMSKGSVFYLGSSPGRNFTANVININNLANTATTAVLIIGQGMLPYYPNVVNIGNVGYGAVKWLSSYPPTANAYATEFYSFTFIKPNNTWVAPLGAVTMYK